ncbi:Protein bimA, partial [Monoraphidium neglectum]
MGPLRRALERLSRHDARGALEALRGLPQEQASTAEALFLEGRASAEAVDYAAAAASFQAARRADPHRVEGLELYSTVLWHLRRETELAHLAQEALAIDRLAPQTWCVVGNCFSLQRDHTAAVAFFQRAMQLDPAFAYAATLAGHEYLAGEDLSAAMTAYRNALRMDGRHYNAL